MALHGTSRTYCQGIIDALLDTNDARESSVIEIVSDHFEKRLVIRTIMCGSEETPETMSLNKCTKGSLKRLRGKTLHEAPRDDTWLVILLTPTKLTIDNGKFLRYAPTALTDENDKILRYQVPWNTLHEAVRNLSKIRRCSNCDKGGTTATMKMCSMCYGAYYCSIECQKLHRPEHKASCKKTAATLNTMPKEERKLFLDALRKDCKMQHCVNSLFYYLLYNPKSDKCIEPYNPAINHTPLGSFMKSMQAHGDMFIVTLDHEHYLGVTIYRRKDVIDKLHYMAQKCMAKVKTSGDDASRCVRQATSMQNALYKVPHDEFIIGYSTDHVDSINFLAQKGNAMSMFIQDVKEMWSYEAPLKREKFKEKIYERENVEAQIQKKYAEMDNYYSEAQKLIQDYEAQRTQVHADIEYYEARILLLQEKYAQTEDFDEAQITLIQEHIAQIKDHEAHLNKLLTDLQAISATETEEKSEKVEECDEEAGAPDTKNMESNFIFTASAGSDDLLKKKIKRRRGKRSNFKSPFNGIPEENCDGAHTS